MLTHPETAWGAAGSLPAGLDEDEARANRRRFAWMALFVCAIATFSLAAYLLLRPHNRHLEPTPYDRVISQFRGSMTEQDVLSLVNSANQSSEPGEVATYDKVYANGTRRIVAYRIDLDEPLEVSFAAGASGHIVDWCYRDHCHDNIY